jgi:transposase
LASGETEEEGTAFLQKMKNVLPFDPFFIILDFSTALIAAAKRSFPHALIGHDLFHVTQLLNDGLLKEMTRRQRLNYGNPIKELRLTSQSSIRAEKENHLFTLRLKEPFVLEAWQAYQKLFQLKACLKMKDFQVQWELLNSDKVFCQWSEAKAFIEEAEATLPKRGLTKKNIPKFFTNCCQIWRRHLRVSKQELLHKKRGFSALRYYVLMKPQNMKASEFRKLRQGLAKFEFLKPIRQAVREFHRQFQETNCQKKDLTFLKALITKDSHPKLKSSINTLIEKQDNIFGYSQILEKHPKLKEGKSIRSTHEEINRKLKSVSRNQYGLRSTPNVQKRMEGLFNCPIFVSEKLRDYEKKNL